jgi:GH24 family phage-related lysozyme (muramidase)
MAGPVPNRNTAMPASLLHPAVKAAWHRFSEPLEGRVHWMYLDILGLVTTGVGNLIDPSSEAVKLPWTINGHPASPEAIRADWDALKARQDLKRLHYKYAAPVTKCRLSDEAIDGLVLAKLEINAAFMQKNYFPDFATWPADAQLAASSMAWACGPGFPATFKNFARFANVQDWAGCKASCAIKTEGNPGVVPRNKANVLCFENAAEVASNGWPVEELHWPGRAEGTVLFDPAEADTEPAVPHPSQPRPEPLAGGFSVAEAVVRDGLKDMSGKD